MSTSFTVSGVNVLTVHKEIHIEIIRRNIIFPSRAVICLPWYNMNYFY